MGHIVCKRIEIITTLSELVGYKAGLALTQNEIVDLLWDAKDILVGQNERMLRIESTKYEELLTKLLYQVGNIPTPVSLSPGIALYNKYGYDAETRDLCLELQELWLDKLREVSGVSNKEREPVDLTLVFTEVAKHFIVPSGNPKAADMLRDFIDIVITYFHSRSSGNFRRAEWANTLELESLFKSESLETFYGSFFDQRFIDYLVMNFNSIDQINWRKFEGLTAEFFNRNDFYVEVGPGRNDDSVDVRVWPREDDRRLSPTTLIQCKRQKEKIEKVIVKALYADILDAGAQSGMIVTTSSLSPGAEKVCTARAYPITQANRDTLRKWIVTMRSPHTGVFLGE